MKYKSVRELNEKIILYDLNNKLEKLQKFNRWRLPLAWSLMVLTYPFYLWNNDAFIWIIVIQAFFIWLFTLHNFLINHIENQKQKFTKNILNNLNKQYDYEI